MVFVAFRESSRRTSKRSRPSRRKRTGESALSLRRRGCMVTTDTERAALQWKLYLPLAAGRTSRLCCLQVCYPVALATVALPADVEETMPPLCRYYETKVVAV